MGNYFTTYDTCISHLQGEFLSLFDATLDSQKLILSIFKKLSNHSRPGDMWARLVPHIDEEEFNSLYILIEQGQYNLDKSFEYYYVNTKSKFTKDLQRLVIGIYYEEKALHFFTKWCKRILKLDELRKKEHRKKYWQRPEVKEYRKKYRQRPEVKEKQRIYDKLKNQKLKKKRNKKEKEE